MRRLHMEYIEALEKLKAPSNPIDSTVTLKSMYPKMFDRMKQNVSPKDPSPLPPSNK